MDRPSKSHATLLGVALGVLGPAHLLCPRAFDGINRLAFDGNIRSHVIINGIIETALGLAILKPRTRQRLSQDTPTIETRNAPTVDECKRSSAEPPRFCP